MSRANDKVMWILGGLLVASLVGMAIGGARLLGYDPSAGPRHELVGRPAPEFDLAIVAGAGAAEGDRISLDGLRGRVVLLDFWASWCQPCRRSIPMLNEVHERYGTRIEMLGVNVDQGLPPERIVDAHASFGAHFPSLGDARLSTQAAYLVTSIPTLVLIDRQGVVRWVDHGVPDPDEVGDRIEHALESEE